MIAEFFSFLGTIGLVLLILALLVFVVIGYIQLFPKLTIEIVDPSVDRKSTPSPTDFIQNAMLIAYAPIFVATDDSTDSVKGNSEVESLRSRAPAPGRPFWGILGSAANKLADKRRMRVVALSRCIAERKKSTVTPHVVSSDDAYKEDEQEESTDTSTATADCIDALSNGESRYLVGIVIAESADPTALICSPELAEALHAVGFTQQAILPPIRTALRLRFAPGVAWRRRFVGRLKTALAGVRFHSSCCNVIQTYKLKPPRSPLIVETYDTNAATFYLPLSDSAETAAAELQLLPPELVCPRPQIDAGSRWHEEKEPAPLPVITSISMMRT